MQASKWEGMGGFYSIDPSIDRSLCFFAPHWEGEGKEGDGYR
jgi:hypothetical protein